MAYLLLVIIILSQSGLSETSSVKYYTFLGSGRELQMKVSIWGEIGSPGMYSIPEGSDLLFLITIAGGPTKYADFSKVKVVRSFPEPEVVKIDLKNFFKTGIRDGIPELFPGDMVFVGETGYRKFKSVLEVLRDISFVISFSYMVYRLVD